MLLKSISDSRDHLHLSISAAYIKVHDILADILSIMASAEDVTGFHPRIALIPRSPETNKLAPGSWGLAGAATVVYSQWAISALETAGQVPPALSRCRRSIRRGTVIYVIHVAAWQPLYPQDFPRIKRPCCLGRQGPIVLPAPSAILCHLFATDFPSFPLRFAR